MIKSRLNFFPNIRSDYNTAQEVGDVINKSRDYVLKRLNGKFDFTYREKCMLAREVGLTEADAREYCRKEA